MMTHWLYNIAMAYGFTCPVKFMALAAIPLCMAAWFPIMATVFHFSARDNYAAALSFRASIMLTGMIYFGLVGYAFSRWVIYG